MSSSKSRMAVRILAVLLCAGGIWVSHHLALLHVLSPEEKTATKKEKGILDQACTALLPQGDCEQVVASEWGTIRIGQAVAIPTALVGLDYFIILLCWFVLVGEVPASRLWAHLVIACLTAAGLGMSVFLLYQMSQLPKPCPLCIVTHIINFLVFGCVLLLWPRKRPEPVPVVAPVPATDAPGDSLFAPTPVAAVSTHPNTGSQWSMLALTPIVALLAISMVTLSLKVRAQAPSEQMKKLAEKLKMTEQTLQAYEKAWKRFDRWEHSLLAWNLNAPVRQSTQDVPVRGSENARHVVIVYSDFECPVCRDFEKWFSEKIQPIAARHGGVKVYFKHWPLCTDCNPKAKRTPHPAACKAALAAQAAFTLGGNEAFWKMHDILFATQDQWKKSLKFEGYAKQIGLDVEKFIQTMNSPETLKRIQADMLEGAGLGQDLVQAGKIKEDEQEALRVDSTPSIYVDNKKLVYWKHAHAWQDIFKLPAPQQTPTPQLPTTTPNSN